MILLNYYSASLSEYVSSTPAGALIAAFALVIVLGVVIRHLTKNEHLAYGFISAGGAVLILYLADPEAFSRTSALSYENAFPV